MLPWNYTIADSYPHTRGHNSPSSPAALLGGEQKVHDSGCSPYGVRYNIPRPSISQCQQQHASNNPCHTRTRHPTRHQHTQCGSDSVLGIRVHTRGRVRTQCMRLTVAMGLYEQPSSVWKYLCMHACMIMNPQRRHHNQRKEQWPTIPSPSPPPPPRSAAQLVDSLDYISHITLTRRCFLDVTTANYLITSFRNSFLS